MDETPFVVRVGSHCFGNYLARCIRDKLVSEEVRDKL
jgi:hypothetical protein